MDRRVTSPKQVTSRTWGPPPPCKQPLMFVLMHVSTEETLRSLSKLLPSISSEHLCFCVPLICLHWHHSSAKKLDTQMNTGEYNSLDIQTGFRKKTSTFLVIFLPFYVVYCILFTDTIVFNHEDTKMQGNDWPPKATISFCYWKWTLPWFFHCFDRINLGFLESTHLPLP